MTSIESVNVNEFQMFQSLIGAAKEIFNRSDINKCDSAEVVNGIAKSILQFAGASSSPNINSELKKLHHEILVFIQKVNKEDNPSKTRIFSIIRELETFKKPEILIENLKKSESLLVAGEEEEDIETLSKLLNLDFYHNLNIEQAKEALRGKAPGHYILIRDKSAKDTSFILLFVRSNKEISQINFRMTGKNFYCTQIDNLSVEKNIQDNILKLAPNGEKLASPVTKEMLKQKQLEVAKAEGDVKANHVDQIAENAKLLKSSGKYSIRYVDMCAQVRPSKYFIFEDNGKYYFLHCHHRSFLVSNYEITPTVDGYSFFEVGEKGDPSTAKNRDDLINKILKEKEKDQCDISKIK